MVLHSGPEEGSQWKMWATNLFCAVCITKPHILQTTSYHTHRTTHIISHNTPHHITRTLHNTAHRIRRHITSRHTTSHYTPNHIQVINTRHDNMHLTRSVHVYKASHIQNWMMSSNKSIPGQNLKQQWDSLYSSLVATFFYWTPWPLLHTTHKKYLPKYQQQKKLTWHWWVRSPWKTWNAHDTPE
jgi:hypothetical protein